MSWMGILATVTPALLFAAALPLSIWAMRGKCIDDHPVCRRCRFDLIGLPAGRAVCSECGSHLNTYRAIQLGNRVKRAQVLQFALPVLALTTIWNAGTAYVTLRGIDLNRYKPFWLLRVEATSHDLPARDRALATLYGRWTRSELNDSQLHRLVRDALDIQGDLRHPWHWLWAQLIEDQRSAGRVSDVLWQRYYRQAAQSAFDVKVERASDSDIWCVQLLTKPARVFASSIMKCQDHLYFEGIATTHRSRLRWLPLIPAASGGPGEARQGLFAAPYPRGTRGRLELSIDTFAADYDPRREQRRSIVSLTLQYEIGAQGQTVIFGGVSPGIR